MSKGICYGVSVGPGDENLLTLEAIETIKKADVIMLPSFPKEDCKAYQIVKNLDFIDQKEIICETFTMSRNASVKEERHKEIFEKTVKLLDEGKNVAFLALGDVMLYATYEYIYEKLLAAGYESEFIPGITSIQAVCAKLNIPIAIDKEQVHIFPGTSNIKENLRTPGTKIFMKTKDSFEEMISEIKEFASTHEGVTVCGVSNCGMPGEIVAKSIDEIDKLTGYFTVIIVKGGNLSSSDATYFENRQCKYYPCHKGIDNMNCLFCYCPMYHLENCPGNPAYKEKEGKTIKVCTNCSFPHNKDNYKIVMDYLRSVK